MNFVKFLMSQYFFQIFYSLISRELLLGLLYKIIDLGFFLRSAQICKECSFLGNLRTITQEGEKELR